MDFSDTPEEAEFRDTARAWLEANVPTADELEGLDEIAAPSSGRNANTTPAGRVCDGRRNSAVATQPPSSK